MILKDKQNIKKILVTRTQSIGDMVCFIPTLRGLREVFPQAEITMLVGRPAGKEIIENCPFVDETIFYDIEKKRTLLEKLRLVMLLRRKGFGLTIASSQEVGFALKAFLSGARYRIGFKEYVTNTIKGRDRFAFLNTVSISDREGEHEVDANLRLLEPLGITAGNRSLELWVKEGDISFVNRVFQEHNLRGRPVVVVNPSSRNRLRNWPVENYAQVLKYLLKEYELNIVLISDRQHMALCESLVSRVESGLVNLAGKTTVGQLTALLSMCDLFIGGDSGPMHIAAAFDTNIVALFGPSMETQFRPYSENSIVINKRLGCAPCAQVRCDSMECMRSITVEDAIRASKCFLDKIPKRTKEAALR